MEQIEQFAGGGNLAGRHSPAQTAVVLQDAIQHLLRSQRESDGTRAKEAAPARIKSHARA